jgi:hypothetical protein
MQSVKGNSNGPTYFGAQNSLIWCVSVDSGTRNRACAVKNPSRWMGRSSQTEGDSRQKPKKQAVWEDGKRRNQSRHKGTKEIWERSRRRLESMSDMKHDPTFPIFSFLVRFPNRKSITCTGRLAVPYICEGWLWIEIKYTTNNLPLHLLSIIETLVLAFILRRLGQKPHRRSITESWAIRSTKLSP